MAFYGKYEHTLDAKKRIFIPAKYRADVGEVFYIVPRLHSHLAIYTQEKWNKLEEKLKEHPDAKVETLRRFIYSMSIDVSCDSHGRITLTPELLEYAKLKKDITIAGMGDYAEIWDSEQWHKTVDSVDLSELEKLYSEF